MATTVMWFRRDLRLEDNLALAAAAADGPVLALFVLDPAFDRAGEPRQAFLSGSLAALDGALDGKLVCRAGDPAEIVPTVAAEVEAGVVVAAEDFGPYGRRRDQAVASALRAAGRALQLEGSPYAVAPGTIRKADGAAYGVSPPFPRQWVAHGWPPPIPAPEG